jgi:hypothetical protein
MQFDLNGWVSNAFDQLKRREFIADALAAVA